MLRRPGSITSGYLAVLAISFVAAVIAGWTPLASSIDGSAYDWMFRLHGGNIASGSKTAVLAIDESALSRAGGMRNVRTILADSLKALDGLAPQAVVIDLVLADEGDRAQDEALEREMVRTPNLILAADLRSNGGGWEDPIPRFRRHAAAVGHVHAEPDPVSRVIALEKAAGRDRRWAAALEALRQPGEVIEESPSEIRIGSRVIPASRADGRAVRIHYQSGAFPVIPVYEIRARALEVRGRTLFIGVTALTAARDRLYTPLGETMSGVEIHAHAFRTLAAGAGLHDVSLTATIALCLALTCVAGLIFAFFSGWSANVLAALLIGGAHSLPHAAFQLGWVMPYLSPVLAVWLSAVSAASWQHFVVRRQLRTSEAGRARYQQAIQFVTHEMRSPLNAIQGSSELMGRYNLTDDKRKQMAQMIHSESKRLAKMIQTFLDIERLTDGQTEIRNEQCPAEHLIRTCVERAAPLAEGKQIELRHGPIAAASVKGDRELLEYAVYNLLTNAIKYSPEGTVTTVRAITEKGSLRVEVADQGIGMDEKELKRIFQRFYRTKKAEASGEAGTGIGLSIVEQIVAHHGGRMEVTSSPGKGSCFTMVLPCEVPAAGEHAPALAPE